MPSTLIAKTSLIQTTSMVKHDCNNFNSNYINFSFTSNSFAQIECGISLQWTIMFWSVYYNVVMGQYSNVYQAYIFLSARIASGKPCTKHFCWTKFVSLAVAWLIDAPSDIKATKSSICKLNLFKRYEMSIIERL